MNRLMIAVMTLVPTLAFAAPVTKAAMDPAKQAQMEKRIRTARTIGLAEALDLDAAKALQLDAQMAQFDDRRKPLHEQLKAARETLERASDGDPAASAQVDQAIENGFQARAQLEQIDRDMLNQVSKGMTPAQKAKFAIFLVQFKHHMMQKMMEHGRRGMHGMHGGPGGFQGGGDDAP